MVATPAVVSKEDSSSPAALGSCQIERRQDGFFLCVCVDWALVAACLHCIACEEKQKREMDCETAEQV